MLLYFTSVVTVSDVLSDAAAKQDRLLWYDTNMRAQPLYVQSSNIVSINRLQEEKHKLF